MLGDCGEDVSYTGSVRFSWAQSEVAGIYETGDHKIRIAGKELIMEFEQSFDAVAIELK